MQSCLSSFKLSCSKCSLMTSTQVSIHPSESSLNSFGFLKVFLDLPPPLSPDSVFLVANASNVLFIISQVLGPCHGIRSRIIVSRGITWTTRRICGSTFHNCLSPPPPVLCSLHPGAMVMVLTAVCSVVVPRNQLSYLAFDPLPAYLLM